MMTHFDEKQCTIDVLTVGKHPPSNTDKETTLCGEEEYSKTQLEDGDAPPLTGPIGMDYVSVT